LHAGRGRRKIVAATGDRQWTITATMTMRRNTRGRKEEVHTRIEG